MLLNLLPYKLQITSRNFMLPEQTGHLATCKRLSSPLLLNKFDFILYYITNDDEMQRILYLDSY